MRESDEHSAAELPASAQLPRQLSDSGRFKRNLHCALKALLADGGIEASTFAYGMRVWERAGISRRWFEARSTSAKLLGMSEATVKRSRGVLVKRGILQRASSARPGRTAEFIVLAPQELVARWEELCDPDLECGSPVTPIEGNAGHERPERGSPVTRLGVMSDPNGGHERPERGSPVTPRTGRELVENGEESAATPPPGPSALRRPGKASKGDRARAEIELAMSRAPEEPEARRAERERRLEILAEHFVACGQVAPEARLRAYFRTTTEIPTELLGPACDAARAAEERGFPPSEAAIIAAGRKLAAIHRKRSRAEPGDASRAGL